MAEARTSGWILALALAVGGGAFGPASAQTPAPGPADEAPVVVDERPVPPSPSGELGDADVARAAAMLRDLAATFATLAAGEGDATVRTDWIVSERTYQQAANLLSTLLAGGQIQFRGLPDGQPAAAAGGGIVLDPTLAGQWQPEAVRTGRRLGHGDWPAISRLAGVLVEQLALYDRTGGWDEWAAAHERAADLRRLAAASPSPTLRPLLARYWHIQDKYLANELAATGADAQAATVRASRAAALSNDMLAVLKQIEAEAGWQWRKPLEAVWSSFTERAHAISAAATAPPAPPAEIAAEPEAAGDSAAEPAVQAPAPAEPDATAAPVPRSTDFDELFDSLGQAPLATTAGPDENAAERAALRADVNALRRETEAQQAATQGLEDSLHGLSARVDELAAGAAEQARQLAALTDRLAAAGAAAEAQGSARDEATAQALADLTARQVRLDSLVADLRRQVGPDGLPRQVAELRATMAAEQSRNRDAEQRLEARVQEGLRDLRGDIEAARRQAADVRAGLDAFRPSATAVAVPLRDEAARQRALYQVIGAGLALLGLLLAAVAFWVRGARRRALAAAPATAQAGLEGEEETPQEAGLSALMEGLRSAERNALRDEMAQLRGEIDSERGRAGDLEARLVRLTARLEDSQRKSERLQADLSKVRAGAQEVGKSVLAGAASGAAMGDDLARLRQQIDAEREHAAALRHLIAETRTAATVAAPVESATPANVHPLVRPMETPRPAPPEPDPGSAPQDPILRRRAVEALHRSDLGGFERAFARLTDLPLPAVQRMIRGANGHELATACRAVGIAKPHYAALLILSHRSGTGAGPLEPRQLAEAMTVFDGIAAETAARALRAWQQEAAANEPQWVGELT